MNSTGVDESTKMRYSYKMNRRYHDIEHIWIYVGITTSCSLYVSSDVRKYVTHFDDHICSPGGSLKPYRGHSLHKADSRMAPVPTQGLYSLSGKTSYRQISWSLEATRLDVIMIISLWNLTGISTALQRCRDACQISEWLGKSKPESHGVETSRDLAVRRPSASISE